MSEQQERVKVLVIDDEPNLRELVAARLEKNGFEVDTASDGYQALNKVSQFKPKLVILDLMLPKMDGYTVCRVIKSASDTEHIKIVMFTARSAIEDERRGKDSGADAYVTKPFAPEKLLRTIDELLYPEKYETTPAEAEAPAEAVPGPPSESGEAAEPAARVADQATEEEPTTETEVSERPLSESDQQKRKRPEKAAASEEEPEPEAEAEPAAEAGPETEAGPEAEAESEAKAGPEQEEPKPEAEKPKKEGFFKRLFRRLFKPV